MTAIFAYAEADIAFIATDTKRGGQYGFEATTANKCHRWSQRVLVGQTGFGEGLQRLFGEMLSWQHRDQRLMSADGLQDAFDKTAEFRRHYERYHLKQNPSAVIGTLVVVEAAFLATPASIRTIDWVTGTKTRHTGPVYADGSDPTKFNGLAQAEYKKLRPTGAEPIDLALWAKACLSAAKIASDAVDWPADLAIVRPSSGCLISLAQRVDGPSAIAHPLFSI